MDEKIRWSGDVEGCLVLEGEGEPRQIDRPGDAFVLLQEFIRSRHPEVAGLAAYTVCLSTRGVNEAHFIRQIYERTFTFVRGADLASKTLFDVITRLQALLSDCVLEGAELRLRFLQEARAIHENAGDTPQTGPPGPS